MGCCSSKKKPEPPLPLQNQSAAAPEPTPDVSTSTQTKPQPEPPSPKTYISPSIQSIIDIFREPENQAPPQHIMSCSRFGGSDEITPQFRERMARFNAFCRNATVPDWRDYRLPTERSYSDEDWDDWTALVCQNVCHCQNWRKYIIEIDFLVSCYVISVSYQFWGENRLILI